MQRYGGFSYYTNLYFYRFAIIIYYTIINIYPVTIRIYCKTINVTILLHFYYNFVTNILRSFIPIYTAESSPEPAEYFKILYYIQIVE